MNILWIFFNRLKKEWFIQEKVRVEEVLGIIKNMKLSCWSCHEIPNKRLIQNENGGIAWWICWLLFDLLPTVFSKCEQYTCWLHDTMPPYGKLVFQWKRFFSVSLIHYSRDLQVQNSATFSLKLGPTAPFTHLKIILLQCFQFYNKQYPNKPICWKISTQHIFLQSHNKGELTLILIWHEETI